MHSLTGFAATLKPFLLPGVLVYGGLVLALALYALFAALLNMALRVPLAGTEHAFVLAFAVILYAVK